MAIQTIYKSYERGPRSMVVEENYQSGMYYTNTPLQAGYLKCITNFDYKDDGTILTPRQGFCAQPIVANGGLQTVNQSLIVDKGVTNYPLITYVGYDDAVEKLTNVFIAGYRDPTLLSANDKTYNVFKADKCKIYTSDLDKLVSPTKTTDPISTNPVVEYYNVNTVMPAFVSVVSPASTIHGCPSQTLNTNAIIATEFDNVLLAVCAYDNVFKLSKVSLESNRRFKLEPLTPTNVSIKEAVTSGYNMLADDPYTFNNIAGTGYACLGIIPYDKADKLTRNVKLSARVGETIYYEIYYAYNSSDVSNVKYRVKIEWAGANAPDTWNVIQTELKANSDNKPAGAILSPDYTPGTSIIFNWAPTTADYVFRVTLYKSEENMSTSNPLAQLVMPMPSLNQNSSYKSSTPTKYNIATATGLTTWKKRLVAWGVHKAESTLFVSDVNNPAYFPYPNNVEVFTEPIVHVVPFMDALLVFTRTRLHMLSLKDDGISYINTVVQNRLHIADSDKYAIQVIKNMVFFKSGNYYYMIVPKVTSLTGELVIAPVSKPITNFLDNFRDSVLYILNHTYYKVFDMESLYEEGFTILGFYTYLDGASIRCVYLCELQGTRVNIVLNYDTNLRVWSTYVHETPGHTIPWITSITQATLLFSVGPEVFYTETIENQDQDIAVCVPYICSFNQADRKDYKRKVLNDVVTTSPAVKNFQFLDTGYRDHNAQLKKRYRELQFTINNASQKILMFSTAFYIDDDRRISYYKRVAEHDVDPNSPNYGLFYMDTVVLENAEVEQEAKFPVNNTVVVPGTTLLNGEYQDDGWVLDFSTFPDLATAKVRVPVSGKGYSPRFKMLAYNEESFELKNINWVSRTLYAR